MPWQQTEIQLQDRASHVLVDDRFSEMVPVAELPCLNWFGVWFVQPAPEGSYVSPVEEAAFLTLERQLIEIAGHCSNGWAVYCLRLLSRGIVEYYFYSQDRSTLEGVIPEMKRLFPQYRIEHDSKEDVSWSEYSKYLKAVQQA